MREAILLEGQRADWAEHQKASEHVMNEDGTANWSAAMCADPGVTSCPNCGEHFWFEGTKLKCPDCGTEWDPRAKWRK